MSWPYARIADLRSTARGVRTRATELAGVGTAAMVVQRDALLTQLLAAEADTPASPAEYSAVNLDELTAIDVHVHVEQDADGRLLLDTDGHPARSGEEIADAAAAHPSVPWHDEASRSPPTRRTSTSICPGGRRGTSRRGSCDPPIRVEHREVRAEEDLPAQHGVRRPLGLDLQGVGVRQRDHDVIGPESSVTLSFLSFPSKETA